MLWNAVKSWSPARESKEKVRVKKRTLLKNKGKEVIVVLLGSYGLPSPS
jgi:hypothetical protein